MPSSVCHVCGAIDCTEHRAPAHRWGSSSRRKRLPIGWVRKRRQILRRDPVCTICNEAPSTEVHHVNGWQDNRDEALAGVCTDCHRAESSAEGHRSRAKQLELGPLPPAA